jgi:hypothetical protein
VPTLSELSTRLFRDVQDNHQRTLRELDDLEHERRTALRELAGAGSALEKWQAALEDAENDLAQTLDRIEQDFNRAEEAAAERRRTALEQADRRFRQADVRSEAARLDAEERARREFEAELDDIAAGRVDAGQQVLARADAYDRLRRKLDASRTSYLASLEANRNAQQDERRTADALEMSDVTSARNHARTLRDRAQQVYARAQKAADTTMRSALERVAGAAELQASFDARRHRIKRESRDREAALFEAYRDARRNLGG